MELRSTAYDALEARFRRIGNLKEARAVLGWDSSAMMPPGGARGRSDQLATLEVVCHELLTAPEVEEQLARAEGERERLDGWRQANLREMRRLWLHATALEPRLVEAFTRAAKQCEMVWRSARPASDFKAVLPALSEVLALVREVAAAKGARLGLPLYDALLDEYEPGGESARIDAIFDDYARFLPGFLAAVLERQAARPAPVKPAGPFPLERQNALARRLMETLGFDFNHGRLDTSLHPFCGGVPDDVRITTRYDESDFSRAMMGVLHETGHALYERGLPPEWRLQPVGEARGMAFHESQSLLVEMQACRSPEFISFLAPLAKAAFAGEGPSWEAENLLRISHRVEPSFIRVDADEVTYPAHVILRYRLEKAMIAGDLALAELPGAWNEGMEKLLGIQPPDDRLGCLQDIHWYDGAWGYFPTYTLGAMTAAQLFAAARAAVPEIPERIAMGDFAPLLGWLRDKVHSQGSRLSGDELLRQVTGSSLDPRWFERHLARRYLEAA